MASNKNYAYAQFDAVYVIRACESWLKARRLKIERRKEERIGVLSGPIQELRELQLPSPAPKEIGE